MLQRNMTLYTVQKKRFPKFVADELEWFAQSPDISPTPYSLQIKKDKIIKDET